MVVLVIIGLMSSAVILTLPRQTTGLEETAKTFTSEINQTANAALISGDTTALAVSREGYALFRFAGDAHTEIARGQWDTDISVTFRRDGKTLDLTDNLTPSVFFEPTGLSTPFRLDLQGPDHGFYILSTGDGGATIEGAP